MRKIFSVLFIFVTLFTNGQDITKIFESMPSDLLPGVTEGNKTMLLVDSGETTIPSPLGEIKKLDLGDTYLKIKTSDVGTLQLKLLPVSKDSLIICAIRTVCADACDSDIAFYTTQWQKIDDSKLLPDVSGKIFFDSSKKRMKNHKNSVSLQHVYPVSAELNKENTEMKLILNYQPFLTAEQIETIKPLMKSDTVILKWKKGAFKR